MNNPKENKDIAGKPEFIDCGAEPVDIESLESSLKLTSSILKIEETAKKNLYLVVFTDNGDIDWAVQVLNSVYKRKLSGDLISHRSSFEKEE